MQESPPHRRFSGGCSSPFMRLAQQHLTALRAWCKLCLPGRWKPDVLRPGIVGMRESMVIRLRPCMTMSTPPPPPLVHPLCLRPGMNTSKPLPHPLLLFVVVVRSCVLSLSFFLWTKVVTKICFSLTLRAKNRPRLVQHGLPALCAKVLKVRRDGAKCSLVQEAPRGGTAKPLCSFVPPLLCM